MSFEEKDLLVTEKTLTCSETRALKLLNAAKWPVIRLWGIPYIIINSSLNLEKANMQQLCGRNSSSFANVGL